MSTPNQTNQYLGPKNASLNEGGVIADNEELPAKFFSYCTCTCYGYQWRDNGLTNSVHKKARLEAGFENLLMV